MRSRMARELVALNTAFYADHAESFSATRSAPWEGWRRVLEVARELGAIDGRRPVVLDLACGNLRFERFLADELKPTVARVDALDNCPDLAGGAYIPGTTLHDVDILSQLMEMGREAPQQDEAAAAARTRLSPHTDPCDLAVCFGFMHHVPGADLRRCVVDELVARTRPGGVVAISLWRFMNDERLARKARAADAAASQSAPWPGFDASELEPGDHFLGWQGEDGPLRYCHHFEEEEVDSLAARADAVEAARFSADGASGDLNRYLILRRL